MRWKPGLAAPVALAAAVWGLAPGSVPPATPAEKSLEMAVTVDDLPLGGAPMDLAGTRQLNTRLLVALARNGIPATGFVNEEKLYVTGEVDGRIGILRAWLAAGMDLGNHTFSHPSLHVTPLDEFEEDVIRGETVTKMLLEESGRRMRWFRHPFLRTGPSPELRREFEAFLERKGYTVAPVTIDNSDWLYAWVYRHALESGDDATAERAVKGYIEFTERQIDFCEKAAATILGRQPRHVLLLHDNRLNADYLDAVAGIVRKRGYRFVTLDRALEDPAYQRPDTYAGPAGVAWLFRWDHAGKKQVDWKLEPEPAAWVTKMWESRSAGN